MTSQLKLNLSLSALLVVFNIIIFNILLRDVHGLRVDMTDGNIYSVSEVTERIVSELEEEVTIKAFFSDVDKIKDDMRPFVPEIKNLLEEYVALSKGRIRVDYIVPEADKAAEAKYQSEFGLRPMIFPYRDQSGEGVKSFYFALVVTYPATKPITIGFDDLVAQNIFEEKQSIELKNVEFEITRAIKKVVFGFESQRGLFSKFDGKMAITTYCSPKEELPELFKEVPEQAQRVLETLAKNSSGKLVHLNGELPADDNARMLLTRRVGVEPMRLPLQEGQFYLWAALEVNGRAYQPIPLLNPEGALGEFELRETFESIVKEFTPGILRKIGIVQAMPEMNPMAMQMRQRPPPPPFAALEQTLRQDYDVQNLDIKTLASVPPDVDVLLIMNPRDASAKAVYAIDQFVMKGGRVIWSLDRHDTEIAQQLGNLNANSASTGLEDLLKHWGVSVSEEVVLDLDCGSMFWTVGSPPPPSQFGGSSQPRIEDRDWATLPQIGRASGTVNRDVEFLAGFELARMWFPSALDLEEVEGIETTWLLRSSEEAWRKSVVGGVSPNFETHKLGYAVPNDSSMSRETFGALLEGEFASYFADRPIPFDDAKDDKPEGEADKPTVEAPEKEEEKQDVTATLKKSRKTRMLFFSDGDWLDNTQAGLAQYGRAFSLFRQNAAAIKDAIGWLLEDDDLARIRHRGRTFRPLERFEDGDTTKITTWNMVIPLLLVAGLGLAAFLTRSNRKSLI